MIELLGQLKYRTSYGQNVLMHSTEMAHMAGMIAEEIGADVRATKIATLLHDVGKAVTHKVEGKHHHIGAELARKYGMDARVVHAIEAHHDDIEATTPKPWWCVWLMPLAQRVQAHAILALKTLPSACVTSKTLLRALTVLIKPTPLVLVVKYALSYVPKVLMI